MTVEAPLPINNSAIPLELPPRPVYFRNRAKELETLQQDLHHGAVITLCGPGGIGKTALAAELVWRLTDDGASPPEGFPDGVIFHSFYNRPTADLALEHIALAYGEEPRPTPALAANRALSNRCALLVLDGAEAVDDLAAVLEVRGGCAALVTSRDRAQIMGASQDLAPLDANSSLGLLRDWGGARVSDEGAARRVCDLLGGLPVALRLAGRYLAVHFEEITEFAAWLDESPLSALDHGRRKLESVPLLLKRSVDSLSPSAAAVLAACGLLAQAPFDRDLIRVALDINSRQAAHALGELVRYGLMWRKDGAYQVSHSLVHTYAAQRMNAPQATLYRLSAAFEELARSGHGSAGFAALDLVRPHILAVLNTLAQRRDWRAVLRLSWAVEDYLDLQCLWDERLNVCQIALDAAQELELPWEVGAWMNACGLTYRATGQGQAAIEQFETALEIARQSENKTLEANTLGNMGNLQRDLGKHEKAVKYYTATLEVARQSGDRRAEVAALGSLGNVHRTLNHMDNAAGYMNQALELARQSSDMRSEGAILGNLGMVLMATGEHDQAISCYQEALQIARRIGDRGGEGLRLGKLGSAYHMTGQNKQAVEMLELAAEIAAEMCNSRAESKYLGELGSLYREMGHAEQATYCLQAALAAARSIPDRVAEAKHLYNLALSHCDLGENNTAQALYKQYKTLEGQANS